MKITRRFHVHDIQVERGNGPLAHTIRLYSNSWPSAEELVLSMLGAVPEGAIRSLQGQPCKIEVTVDFGEYDADT
jgi:hypothetical protein